MPRHVVGEHEVVETLREGGVPEAVLAGEQGHTVHQHRRDHRRGRVHVLVVAGGGWWWRWVVVVAAAAAAAVVVVVSRLVGWMDGWAA